MEEPGTSPAPGRACVSSTLGVFWRGGISQELLLPAPAQPQATAPHVLGASLCPQLWWVSVGASGGDASLLSPSWQPAGTAEAGSHFPRLPSSLPNSPLRRRAGLEIKMSPSRASRCQLFVPRLRGGKAGAASPLARLGSRLRGELGKPGVQPSRGPGGQGPTGQRGLEAGDGGRSPGRMEDEDEDGGWRMEDGG